MGRRWGVRATVAVVAVVAVAGLGVLGFRAARAEDARAASCERIQQQVAERGEVVTVEGSDVHVAILGDSYSTGDGLDDWREAWPYALQEATGATVSVAGMGMTGFTNGGFCGGDEFGSRADDLATLNPDVVIVQGGINDWEAGADQITDATYDVLTSFDVPVILIGPTASPERPQVAAVDAALRTVSEATGATYVSMLAEDLPLLPDGVHLTEEGHARFAETVAAVLD